MLSGWSGSEQDVSAVIAKYPGSEGASQPVLVADATSLCFESPTNGRSRPPNASGHPPHGGRVNRDVPPSHPPCRGDAPACPRCLSERRSGLSVEAGAVRRMARADGRCGTHAHSVGSHTCRARARVRRRRGRLEEGIDWLRGGIVNAVERSTTFRRARSSAPGQFPAVADSVRQSLVGSAGSLPAARPAQVQPVGSRARDVRCTRTNPSPQRLHGRRWPGVNSAQGELGPHRLAAFRACDDAPVTAQLVDDGDATTSRGEQRGNDSDGIRLRAVLDFQQQRLLEPMQGHPERRLCVHHRVRDQFAHDQFNVVSQVRQ